ncbi:hypothetical protein ACH5RR_012820 [Cinchona calisaya]|uniref:Uncharacterized protein n=1 Tax=Cinchona calisaya TaxID=153742 RepID=A0ABD3A8U8_9GENT
MPMQFGSIMKRNFVHFHLIPGEEEYLKIDNSVLKAVDDGNLTIGSETIYDVLKEVDAGILALQDMKAKEEKNMNPLSNLPEALNMNYVFAGLMNMGMLSGQNGFECEPCLYFRVVADLIIMNAFHGWKSKALHQLYTLSLTLVNLSYRLVRCKS